MWSCSGHLDRTVGFLNSSQTEPSRWSIYLTHCPWIHNVSPERETPLKRLTIVLMHRKRCSCSKHSFSWAAEEVEVSLLVTVVEGVLASYHS